MNFFRKLYYVLSPEMRLKARQAFYAPSDLMDKMTRKSDKIVPPKGLIFTGSGDFLNQGERYLNIFKKYGGLQPNHDVLDIGSGIGRMAIPLAYYMDKTARYEGFDVMKVGVEWCQKNLTPLHPNFNFTYVPLKNDLYTKNGEASENFTFPYKDNSFDFCFLTSVFTHMTDKQVENYLQEIKRVLRPKGRCLATFFILNATAKPDSNSEFQFPYDYQHYRLMDDNVKSANVAYEQRYLENFAEKINFTIKDFHFGFWSHQRKKEALDFQDIIIFEK